MDTWKEMSQARKAGETRSLTSSPGSRSQNSVSSSYSKATPKSLGKSTAAAKEKNEADILDTGFTLRELHPQAIRFWVVFQVLGTLFLYQLWSEVGTHLEQYASTVAAQCPPEKMQHGVCVGPMWNVSTYQDIVLSSESWSSGGSQSFDFQTHSTPPTFLVAVDPVSRSDTEDEQPPPAPASISEVEEMKEASWSLKVARVDPIQTSPDLQKFHKGQDVATFEDLSVEAQRAMAQTQKVSWRGTLQSRSYSRKKRNTRFVVFVEDSNIPHLSEVHANSHCAFGRSWKEFNKQYQGHKHQTLEWCRYLLGWFIFIGVTLIYFVYSQLTGNAPEGSSSGFAFHFVVLIKFILQDVPQQICIVLYLLGWYEASGLRCQLCLFYPEHCVEEHPFRLGNLIALICVLGSSVTNQLLIRPAWKRIYTEDDICLQHSVRISAACVATLPFTTGVYWATNTLLTMPILAHLIVAGPCAIGWLTVVGLVMFPILVCCDDDCV